MSYEAKFPGVEDEIVSKMPNVALLERRSGGQWLRFPREETARKLERRHTKWPEYLRVLLYAMEL